MTDREFGLTTTPLPAICSSEKLVQTTDKEWVGLTKDEVETWELPVSQTVYEFVQFVEAKLKDKNYD